MSKSVSTEPGLPSSRWLPTRAKAVKIALVYAGAGVLWISGSDWVVHHFAQDNELAVWLDAVKGCAYVAVTALLLGLALSRYFHELRRSAAQLQDHEARLRIVDDNLPDSYVYQYTSDSAGNPRFLHISAGVERVHGVTVAEVLRDANCLLSQMDPAQLPDFMAAEKESARTMTDFDMELRIRRPDGSARLVQARSRPRRNEQGQVLWDGFVTDITERRHIESDQAVCAARYRSLFDNLLNGFAHCRMIYEEGEPVDFIYLDVNPTFRKLTGLNNVVGKRASEVIPGIRKTDPELIAIYGRVAAGGAPEQFEQYVAALKDWFMISVYSPAPEHFAVVFDVITDRKRTEAALRQNEEEARIMFETASIGLSQADPQTGRWLRVNRQLCEITGYSAAEMLQKRVPEITHPEDRAGDWEGFQRVVRGEAPNFHIEKRFVRKDGNIVWVNVNATVVRDAAGRPVRTFATIEDITARRQAEEERMRLSTALEQTTESIVITDLAGMIVYVNPAFEQITGYSRREAIGQNPRLLKSGRHDKFFYRQIWATIARGEVWHGHFVNRRKDGTLYEEDATISPVRDAAGKIVNYMAIKLDVTREMELESQFRQAQKLEAIGQLAGGVAHDFNNILTSIQMQIALGSMAEDLSHEVRESFAQIRCDADRAASLTRQLLLFSRRQVMRSQDLNLNELVTNLAKMLQRIIGEDVRLQLQLHSAPLMTHADPGMLDQVVMNLVVNGRDAMPEGGRLLITTSEKIVDQELARHQPDAVPGRYVCLSVSDTGCGIPPEVLPRIFEPFFTTKETGKGTGLGLATVFGIVKQHHGWLAVDTQPGHGATFQIFLPALVVPSMPAVTEAPPAPRGGTEIILLAEDEMIVRNSIRTILARSGYGVVEAANGPAALAVWEEHRATVALLLTDLVMPGGMSGRQLARQLQTDNPKLRVVYTSGYSANIAGQELHLQNGERFVQKPLQPLELLKAVRDCLDEVPCPAPQV